MPERAHALAVADRFGDNLRRIRKREDLSQEELARRASLHRTEIGYLEHGERVCRIDTLIRLAGAMAVPPGELLGGIDWVPGPEPEGTFTFRKGPRVRPPRQPSSPAIDQAEEDEESSDLDQHRGTQQQIQATTQQPHQDRQQNPLTPYHQVVIQTQGAPPRPPAAARPNPMKSPDSEAPPP